MLENIILIFGLSVAGLTVGYLTGASGSPVVSIVLPLLFGLAATGLALFQPAKQLSNIPKEKINDHEWIKSFMEGVQSGQKKTKQLIGLSLIFFSIFYLSGTVIGAKARIEHWIVKPKIKTMPWTKETRPKTIDEALTLIMVTEQLANLGYTDYAAELTHIRAGEIGINLTNGETDRANQTKTTQQSDVKKILALLEQLQDNQRELILKSNVDPLQILMNTGLKKKVEELTKFQPQE
ncbi:hypothetical protein [Maridesulfovibrio sp.]|uniref:hypothetical protein n=1 Tax=Maridesulfovibrio sp. TaxID=2795000 RepID=UPI002AA95435|nr:hypothetical protein [Maridesulfovibrio sp.]